MDVLHTFSRLSDHIAYLTLYIAQCSIAQHPQDVFYDLTEGTLAVIPGTRVGLVRVGLAHLNYQKTLHEQGSNIIMGPKGPAEDNPVWR